MYKKAKQMEWESISSEDDLNNRFNFFDPIPGGESDEVIAEWWRSFIGYFLGLEIQEFDVNNQTEEFKEEDDV